MILGFFNGLLFFKITKNIENDHVRNLLFIIMGDILDSEIPRNLSKVMYGNTLREKQLLEEILQDSLTT